MPVISTVIPLSGAGLRTAGDCLRAIRDGNLDACALIAVPVEADGAVAADQALDEFLEVRADDFVKATDLTGKPGQNAQAVARAGSETVRIVFLGVGDRSPRALRRAGGELGRMLQAGERALSSVVAGREPTQILAFGEGVILGSYRYTEKSTAGDQAQDAELRLLVSTDGSDGSTETGASGDVAAVISEATTVATAVALARDLTNTPSLRKSPQWLADAAVRVAADSGLVARIWTDQELASSGFGGITAVGSGSDRPPRLIELSYVPGRSPAAQAGQPAAGATDGKRRHVVLVGKGITFDSGGLSLKPNDGMKAMKTDMAGGAAVIAVMSALAQLGVADQVTGLVAAAENLPSGSAYRPGDVLTAFGGRTVEVLNTDAEGRLVLADAIAYADEVLEPDQIVDVATLTGAARIALGGSLAALYSTSDELAAALIASGEQSGDRLWRMPLVDDYRSVLDSPVADIAHVPRNGSGAGSITAALFLKEFAGTRPWAHLDIAGAARKSGDEGELSAGGTGFGTRLLLRWLQGSPVPDAGADQQVSSPA
ncbi:MAG: leucyl aminopeptidase family protein [Nocardiopsaceae bacterium]|jgi:leucyl aminopeptidase|nr:leucyl aminopeptidase family protein [Nocardiopsaceae bacterium]